jgi:hypothetical protein
MTLVYAFPRVGKVAVEWTVMDPIAESTSLLTGRRFVTAAKRRRRMASVRVSGLTQDGGGMMEVLKDYLRGGVNLVRLRSTRNVLMEAPMADNLRRLTVLDWTVGSTDNPLAWQVGTGPDPLRWVSGVVLPVVTLTDSAGYPAAQVSGLPPNRLIARAGEFLEGYVDLNTRQARRIVRRVWSDASGVALVRLVEAFSIVPTGGASFAAEDEGVFAHVGPLPRAQQPAFAEFSYDWEFREVFADEVTGGFTERNPWL